jgi:solute:Na+ symporter, SSS family
MQLSYIDWIVIAAYFAVNLGIGFYYSRRASGDVGEFFLSGRSVSWWLAGTSMVATTFAADTPLVVTGLIYRQGISGNWLWWTLALSGMMTVFFFAPLWRRSGVLTDMEFVEIRYAGKPASFLRGFRAIYLVVVANIITMGWVNLAMAKILYLTLGLEKLTAVFLCLAVTLVYCTLSGMWAVLWTDLIQFVLKMSMVILLAWFAVRAVGGLQPLSAHIHALDAVSGHNTLAFLPKAGSEFFFPFLVLLSVNWWSTTYPGAEPGGGGYIAQRIFSAKDEKNSLGATLWFNLAHYALRPWPWIITALVAIVLIPHPADPEGAYIEIMIRYLPASLRGLMLAGFAAAYMSTIGTHLNLTASYLLNDVYRRFLKPNESDRHYVAVSRWATLLVAIGSAIATMQMKSIAGAWGFLMALGAGAGLVFILRWFWWRISAWSEISALLGAATYSSILQSRLAMPLVNWLHGFDPMLPLAPLSAQDQRHGFAWLMIITTILTTITWLTVTLLTKPEPQVKLQAFYDKVRPAYPGWTRFAPLEARGQSSLAISARLWVYGFALIYCALFGTGQILLGSAALGSVLLAAAAVCGFLIFRTLDRYEWNVFK